MAVLYTQHFVQFFDDNGNPLSGGKLYTYSAGTSTPKATYTDSTGSTPNANPVVLDSSGRATIFLNGSYKFTLKTSADVTIKETDNVTAFTSSGSSVDSITTSFTEDVVTASDSIIFSDASDSGNTKRDTVQGILDLVPSNYRGAVVYNSSAQPISSGTYTVATFNSEILDTDNIHDTVTNNSRLTVPSGVTKIRLIGMYSLVWSSSMVSCQFKKNGSFLNNSSEGAGYASEGGTGWGFSIIRAQAISAILTVSSGDYFELSLYQTSGSSCNTADPTWFEMQIIA